MRERTQSNATRLLCQRAIEKKSNLIFGCDVSEKSEFERMLKATAEEIVALKTHVDILGEFDAHWWASMCDICRQHGIVLFEDRKFADVGNTVRLQYERGVYRIADWANLVTVHAVAGEGTMKGLATVAEEKSDDMPRGAVMLCQMTGKGTLATGAYTGQAIGIASQFPSFCAGFIGNASNPIELRNLASIRPPGTLILAPGITLDGGDGALGQQHATPAQAIENGADFIIVSSGIYQSTQPMESAKRYRTEGWREYEHRQT